MFSRTSKVILPQCTQVRGMATLKEIRLRLKSVSNIKKITSSMKMVSAAKYARAERDLKPARAYGAGASSFFDMIEVDNTGEGAGPKNNKLIVALTSDKGLCGGVHAAVCKTIKAVMNAKSPDENIKLFLVGDKANQMLTRLYGNDVLMVCKNIGKKPPNFNDATLIAEQILASGFDFDEAKLYFNTFKTVVSYRTTDMYVYNEDMINKAPKLDGYDSLDGDLIKTYNEFMLASRIYFALKEAACSEQSARMTAMDSASKNADEMIQKLNLTYNRTRQAVITKELIEIISGADAL